MNIVIVGHVDHGKSTIIGRLLADTNSLPEGKLQQVKHLCERTSKPFEYAFLLDALKDEQAQGITIDSARVFFKSATRHYIIIDAPGHIEFLKNMITGASRAEAALLVIDAAEGVRENSRRHGYMLAMLGLRKVAVLVNKMDLVGYREDAFDGIRAEYARFLADIDLTGEQFVPVSGTRGDNVASASERMPWYAGPSVLDVLDGFDAQPPDERLPFRMPVQDVYKFTRFGDARRIIAGSVATGRLRVGDRVSFYPSGKSSVVKSLETFPMPASPELTLQHVGPGDAVGFTLEEQLYVTRGDLAARVDQAAPRVGTRLDVSLFWLGRRPLALDHEFLLRVGTVKVRARLASIARLIDASTLLSVAEPQAVGRHDVADCTLACDQPLAFDRSTDNVETGRFVIIDDYEIRGGGIIHDAESDQQARLRDLVLVRNLKWEKSQIGRIERAEHYSQQAALVLITGEERSGRKDLAKALEVNLFSHGRYTYYLALGSLLYGVDADLKTPAIDSRTDHRAEHVRRFAEVAHLFLDAGMILVSSAIELTQDDLATVTTIMDRYCILVVWVGDRPTTDVHIDVRLESHGTVEEGVSRIKASLQESGIIFGSGRS